MAGSYQAWARTSSTFAAVALASPTFIILPTVGSPSTSATMIPSMASKLPAWK